MIFKNDSLFKSRIITRKLIDVLSEECRFQSMIMSMPDMLTCHLNGSNLFPKATSVNDSPMITCSIVTYYNCIVFTVSCFEADDCENIINRLNQELPYLKEQFNNKINKVETLIYLKIIDENDMEYLSKTNNTSLIYQILKTKVDEFFEKYANEILSKIIEIIMEVKF